MLLRAFSLLQRERKLRVPEGALEFQLDGKRAIATPKAV
jgi:hypothetical protein